MHNKKVTIWRMELNVGLESGHLFHRQFWVRSRTRIEVNLILKNVVVKNRINNVNIAMHLICVNEH